MEKLNKYIEHTLLKQDASKADLLRIFDEAKKYDFLGVCINPCYVKLAKENLKDANVKVVTVIGFPLGANKTETKVFETKEAVKDGADEIDMVINIGALKAGETEYVTEEIRALKRLCGERVLKVIVETCFLTEEEKIAACKCVTDAGADFIKTSTGFGSKGATLEDIKLFKEHIGEGVQMKAAGGIHTREEMEGFIAAGCTRLGASAAVKVLKDEVTK